MLLLAGINQRNTSDPKNDISEDGSFVKVTACMSTTGYLVKNEYLPTLIDNIRDGIEHLLRNPDNPFQFSIDVFWKRLQEKDRWILLLPQCVVQTPGYSDIQIMEVNNVGDLNSMTTIN